MILSLFMIFYRLLWFPALPLLLIYLLLRGRKDPRYLRHISERFGLYRTVFPKDAIWFHAVSLGEVRSALGVIRMTLARGDKVILTNFTPAGREEAERQFASEIAAGDVVVVWVPLDMFWCLRRFYRAARPKFGMTLEVEIWPAMVASARKAGVPLYLCNAQYATGPMARDARGLRIRQRLIASVAGAFVKSDLQKERFASVGTQNITVTGELRFDQPIPPALLAAAEGVRPDLAWGGRNIITLASGVAGEEDIYKDLILTVQAAARAQGAPAPLFIYVPRAPERFEAVCALLAEAGLRHQRRSAVFGAGPEGLNTWDPTWAQEVDVLVGDSLGEMYFYLALADQVIVGGGFTQAGAHNIIEPLALGKAPVTGAQTWPIEFPFVEAEAAGVAQSCETPAAMADALWPPRPVPEAQVARFMELHRGASARTLAAMDSVLCGQGGH